VGGWRAIREQLGFPDWIRGKPNLSTKAATAFRAVDRELGEAAAAVDTVELQDPGQVAKEASDAVHTLETLEALHPGCPELGHTFSQAGIKPSVRTSVENSN